MKIKNVLSVFGGIEAGYLSLLRAGITPENYYSSEIDKHACKVVSTKLPQVKQLGDITKWREWDLDWGSIDLFIGGSPCTGFSAAGKQAGTSAEVNGNIVVVTTLEQYEELRLRKLSGETIIFLSQSYLFWEYVAILKHLQTIKPEIKFLLENVKMKKEYLNMIDEAIGVKSVVINSSLLSAQNRVRHYWCNWNVSQPQDKGILLCDILEDAVDIKYNISKEAIDYMGRLRNGKPRWEYHKNPVDGKAACLTANMFKGVPYGTLRLENKSATKNGKAYTLTASQGNCVAWNSIERKQRTMIPVCESTEVNPNVYEGILYRKLTPVECERLQTFPDGWTEGISNTQRYKALGNSWTVDVIAHIFKEMLK